MSLNRNIGALMMVAGMTLGAGMLGLPITSANFGFMESFVLITVMWALMAYTAVQTLRLNEYYGKGVSIVYIAEQTLGIWGKRVGLLSLTMLFYALLAAYMTGGASLLDTTFKATSFDLSRSSWIILFACVLGGIITAHIKAMDGVNRILVILKTTVFALILVLLFPNVVVENLTYSKASIPNLCIAIPVFFTSFGFHGSIPTLVNYLGVGNKNIKTVFIAGSLISLVVYVLWQMATLGVLPSAVAQMMSPGQDLGGFINEVGKAAMRPDLSMYTNAFAFLAISTSFLGVGIGFLDFMIEQFNRSESFPQRLQASLMTFLPPLCFALFYPQGFVMALGFAGIFLSLLAVVLPSLALMKLPILKSPLARALNYMVFCVGLGIIGVEIWNKCS